MRRVTLTIGKTYQRLITVNRYVGSVYVVRGRDGIPYVVQREGQKWAARRADGFRDVQTFKSLRDGVAYAWQVRAA
jgi:hypothetical protein